MITRLSPAKVNLYLRVLGKRDDGYHEIATLIQPISLYDTLEFRYTTGDVSISCPGSTLPENEHNIVHRAATRILDRAKKTAGVHITIHKKIPIAAGLGGGSSNAATTLVTLNNLMDIGLSTDELIKLGKELGADVPFFIYGKTAWAFGIGEHLQPAENIPFLWYVLVNPRIEVSTKMVYEKLNLQLTNETFKYNNNQFSTLENIKRHIHNDLEEVTISMFPVIQHVKDLLIRAGAHCAVMSGSGPTVAGVFGNESEAIKAEESLKEVIGNRWLIYRAHSL